MEGGKLKNKQFYFGFFISFAIIIGVTLFFFFALNYNSKLDKVEGSTFLEKKEATICKEDGKPVIYLFSTSGCSHCVWVKSAYEDTVNKYADKIKAYQFDLITGDNLLTAEIEKQIPKDALAVYSQFNSRGTVPTFVFGCKYFRIGNGYEKQSDLKAEANEFETTINKLIINNY